MTVKISFLGQHAPPPQERAVNLSMYYYVWTWTVSPCLVELSGGALPSTHLSCSLATIPPPEPKDFDFSYIISNKVLKDAERNMKATISNLQLA